MVEADFPPIPLHALWMLSMAIEASWLGNGSTKGECKLLIYIVF